jgi:hypothetical protein
MLYHVLSFLSSKQAVGAAALSSRWCGAFASIHTIFVEEPEGTIPTYDDCRRRDSHKDDQPKELEMPLRFGATMSVAIVARRHHPDGRPRYCDAVAMD